MLRSITAPRQKCGRQGVYLTWIIGSAHSKWEKLRSLNPALTLDSQAAPVAESISTKLYLSASCRPSWTEI